ncbi:hypothetical protein [Streptomyces pratensis]|uniref:hypothetical protein n=1 Tax=Streptomyces pratensis TaxID=1169025 RepID=UPI0030158B72
MREHKLTYEALEAPLRRVHAATAIFPGRAHEAYGQTRGQAFVAAAATVLDQAEKKVKQAAEESGRAINTRAEAKQKDTYLREYLKSKRDLSLFEGHRAGVTLK